MKAIRPMIQQIFSNVSDPMLVVNRYGEVEYCNKNAQDLLYISENSKRKLEMDENSKSSWTSFLNKIRKQKSGTCIVNIKLPNSNYIKVKLEGYLYNRKNLIFVRILNFLSGTYSEIKEKYFSDLLDELSHGVIISDLEGNILNINKKALQYTQCEYEKIINQSHQLLFNQLDDFQFNKLKFYQDVKNVGQGSIVLRSLNSDQEQYFRVESKMNKRKNIIVSTITDITVEYELNNQEMKKLEEVNKLAATIAHEIRNPMTSLKGFIDLLKNSYSTSNEYERYLNVMESELERIDQFLKDILKTTKPTIVNAEKIDLINTVKNVVELMQPYARKKKIIIAIESGSSHDFSILGDENQIKQVIINLIKNAIEVMKNGGYITIGLSKKDNNMIQLSIQDEGSGIPKEHLNNLFDPFFTTKENGTGIGLSIVKKIVEKHRGNIKVESMLNFGSTFYIEFPTYDLNVDLREYEEILFEKSLSSLSIT